MARARIIFRAKPRKPGIPALGGVRWGLNERMNLIANPPTPCPCRIGKRRPAPKRKQPAIEESQVGGAGVRWGLGFGGFPRRPGSR